MISQPSVCKMGLKKTLSVQVVSVQSQVQVQSQLQSQVQVQVEVHVQDGPQENSLSSSGQCSIIQSCSFLDSVNMKV